MTAPTYNPATDTLVYVANSSDASNADITTMGAAPLGNAPRIITHPSPVSPFGASAITATQAVVPGKGGVGKAFSMLYPAGDATKAQDFIVCKPAVPPGLGVTHFIQFAVKFTSSDGDGSETFPIKFFRLVLARYTGGSAPQWSTHDHLPWLLPSGGSQNPGTTYWEYVNGYGDDARAYPQGKDQGIQPIGPYWKSSVNSVANDGFWNYLIEFRPHSAALEADGTTMASVSITGDGTHNTGLTAVFSSSMAGKIANGQTLALAPFAGTGGYVFGAFLVSAFDGDRTCTLNALISNTRAPASGTTAGIHYALAFDGCARLYVNGTKILDVSQAALDAGTPPGGEKQWCSPDILATISVDDKPDTTYPLWFGGDHSSLTPTKNVTMLLNCGDGDPANIDTLAWWTTPYVATGAAHHLALTTQPSASTPAGQAHAQQPAGVIQDSSNATVTGDTTTVTATLVLESGTGTARGTTSVNCIAGVFGFTNLGVDSATGCTAHWDLSRAGLPTISTSSFTITPPTGPLSYAPNVP